MVSRDQNRVDESKLADTLGNLLNLRIGVGPGVVRIRCELSNRAVLDLPNDHWRESRAAIVFWRHEVGRIGRSFSFRLDRFCFYKLTWRKRAYDCWGLFLGCALLLIMKR